MLGELQPDTPDAWIAGAVADTERAANAAAAHLWARVGLQGPPPRWNDSERAGARALLASLRGPLGPPEAARIRLRLLGLAAERWSALLVSSLRDADEEPLRRALGDRYASVRARYAPRTRFSARELSVLLAREGPTTEALRRQLVRWQLDGFDLERLAERVEAAFVQARAPVRLA